MQQEANIVTNKSKEEQAEVEEELARMAKLVFTFQVCKHSFLSASTELMFDLVSHWLHRPGRAMVIVDSFFCLQSHISKFLPDGLARTDDADPATPE